MTTTTDTDTDTTTPPAAADVFAAHGGDTGGPVLPGQLVRVQLTGGDDFTVRVTNRELVAWDLTRPKRQWPAANQAMFLFLTFTAWKAAIREGRTTLTFDQWSDAVEDIEEAGEVETHPTKPGHEPN